LRRHLITIHKEVKAAEDDSALEAKEGAEGSVIAEKDAGALD